MKRMTNLTAAAIAAAVGSVLAPAALAQQFTNADFETGDLSGWTVQLTFNGFTNVQDAVIVDIDGPGPLMDNYAARFQVGNAMTISGHEAGVDLFQPLSLAANTVYHVSFNWASLSAVATNNADGGVYSVYFDGQLAGTQSAGNSNINEPKYGFVTGEIATTDAGLYDVGARITRRFLVSGPQQHVDNFTITPVTGGACCMPNGTCSLATSTRCSEIGGAYQGDNTLCTGQCPQPGACCVPTGCTIVSEGECLAMSGVYIGNGTTCAGNCPPASQMHFVVPAEHEFTNGASTNNHLTNENPRTLQYLFAASEIPIAPGSQLTGITWRIASSATLLSWPEFQADWTDFNIEIASAATTPAGMSVLFDNNIGAGAVTVREGPLTIPANAFTAGVAAPGVNDWGPTIPFTNPYTYNGGDLVITIRQSGNSTGTNRALDSIATSNAAAGYGTRLRALGATSFQAANGTFTNSPVAYIEFLDSGDPPCYANCDGSTVEPVLNVDDFTCFINEFAAAQSLPHEQQVTHYANCDGSTVAPALNVDDFTCFINEFAQGCP